MLQRSQDAAFLNRVLNDITVLPGASCGVAGALDISQAVEDPRNYFLANEFGGFLLVDRGEGLFEVHTNFLPAGRGRKALAAAREAIQFMFTKTPCQALFTYCMDEHPETAVMARWAGFKPLCDCRFLGQSGKVYALKREDACPQS